MFTTKKLNDIKIKPVISHSNENKDTIRGYDYYPEVYSNIALLARKKSGKTNCIYRALEKCAYNCDVYIFAPTVNIDPTYKKMIKMLKKKKCKVYAQEHFRDGKEDMLSDLLLHLKERYKDDDEPEHARTQPQQAAFPLLLLDNDNNTNFEAVHAGRGRQMVMRKAASVIKIKKEEKGGKGKMIGPDSILIFDDLSSDMRCNQIYQLLTKNRHYKLKVFMALHSITNLLPGAINCLDYIQVFGNVPDNRIDELREKACIEFAEDTKKVSKLQQLYNYATSTPWSFLFIDSAGGKYRRNYDELIEV